jgi:hypothetical protein
MKRPAGRKEEAHVLLRSLPAAGAYLGSGGRLLKGVHRRQPHWDRYFGDDQLRQTRAEFFAPALAVAAQRHDPGHRVHVVALRRRWEAAYFPQAGLPITRGWYRQAGAVHNSLFYTSHDEQGTWRGCDTWAHDSFTVRVDRPGAYLIRVTWTPYWTLEGAGRLAPGSDRFIRLEANMGASTPLPSP